MADVGEDHPLIEFDAGRLAGVLAGPSGACAPATRNRHAAREAIKESERISADDSWEDY